MNNQDKSTDERLLADLGARLKRMRLAHNITQTQLAEQAGISKSTIVRLEAGSVASQLSAFIRVCRVLGILDRFNAVVPEPTPSPMEQLKLQGRQRQRARRPAKPAPSAKYENTIDDSRFMLHEDPPKWKWGDET